ncbi:MAG: hypothetical protein LIO96_05020, partial [Lachnospiraceae bacterium]|nr:hypothetical protein [Lachnospiraceae bacterium]
MNKMMSTAENNPEITFENYEKISDILLYFDKDISLRFNVRMARKNKKGSRKYFHSEVQYVSKQYTDQP